MSSAEGIIPGRCEACPVAADRDCYGAARDRTACELVRRGQPGRAEWLVRRATGQAPAPDPGRIDVRLAMLADLCPSGKGCICSSRPCSHPDRPEIVTGSECRACVAGTEWEAGVEGLG